MCENKAKKSSRLGYEGKGTHVSPLDGGGCHAVQRPRLLLGDEISTLQSVNAGYLLVDPIQCRFLAG